MKKINAILSNSTKEQYPVLINKLSDIIEPFALHAVGLPPVYVGLEVEQLTVKQSGESVYVFGINGKDVAHVDTEKAEASVFGGKTFAISAEDVKSVTNTLTALHNCKEENALLREFLRIYLENSNLFLGQLSWYLNSVREEITKEGF